MRKLYNSLLELIVDILLLVITGGLWIILIIPKLLRRYFERKDHS